MALKLDSVGKPIGPIVKEYDWRDVVLYALGVGAGFDELDYVYERKLKVIPSFSIGTVFDFLREAVMASGANLAGILHGEQDILFHHPIPVEGTLTTEGAVTHMYDKGKDKGALVIAEATTTHSNGDKLFTNIFTLFCRRDGGFGGPDAPPEDFSFPDRAPDFEEPARPTADQPLLYRLSGDIFPLHVDPSFAKASGFEKPIMHGLCTHGYACRAVVKHLFPGEPERIARYKARFSKPLYPGKPIKTQIWKIDEGLALFRVLNAETGDVVIDRGVVEYLSREGFEERESKRGVRFDDRVAIVTGAGAGLGRAYAVEMAKRGAKGVVNDRGGPRDGAGEGSARAADAVVEEIRALGGEAVASYDSVATVAGGQAIIDKAIEAFGRVDVLVNNAGILRDKSFAKLDPADWQAVVSVHLDGAYNVARPAFLKMKEQGYGRIVLTSSAAGLFGNFGQANYGAAKLGLVGLMNTLELEGGRSGILVNTVAPLAATRLTADILPPAVTERLQPEYVAPLVLYLCSERCEATGGIYNAGAGYFSRAAIVAGPGAVVGDGPGQATAEGVAAAWQEILSLDGAEEYHDAMAALQPMMSAFTKPKKAATTAAPAADDGGAVAAIFEGMPAAFVPDAAAGVSVVFQFRLTGSGGGEWHAIIDGGKCEVHAGGHAKPTTTIIMSAADFVDLIGGKLNAMKAYTGGQLKIEGDLMKSQLIEKIFKF